MTDSDYRVVDGVSIVTQLIPGPADFSDLSVRVYRPLDCLSTQQLPALLYMHGGGFAGDMDSREFICLRIVRDCQCVLISVDYRLVPEYQFPAAPEDCYAALLWLANQSHALGLDKERIAVGGHSAGACLATSVALMARDRKGPKVIFQLLIYPALDDREEASFGHRHRGEATQKSIVNMWQTYLGEQWREEDLSPYAAPARALDLQHLPAAYVLAGGLDPFRDEAVDYSTRLANADVSTELHVFPDAVHAFDTINPQSEVAVHAIVETIAALKKAFFQIN